MTEVTDSTTPEGELESDELEEPKKRGLPAALEKYKFQPGQSGNPSGVSRDGSTKRNRDFRDRIGTKTNGGHTVVNFLVSVMNNEVFDKQSVRGAKSLRKQVSIKDRIQAAKLLAEFGFGKPAPQLQVPTTPQLADAGPKVVILQLTPQEVVDGGLAREAEIIDAEVEPAGETDGGSGSTQIPTESLPTEHLAGDGLGVSEGDRAVAPEGGERQDDV